ncbi:MAG: 5-bromo-4-chloroindolyl phosphate hydrolysis family protein, partial [Candidatus Saccharibacteria bacterium]
MNKSTTGVVSAAVGGAGFLAFLFLLQTGLPIAIGAGIASFAGTALALGKSDDEGPEAKLGVLAGDATIAEAHKKLQNIHACGRRVQDTAVRQKVEAICGVADKIFEDLRNDPRDIQPAKKFLTYYLDATANILEKYLEISSKGLNGPEVTRRMAKVSELLDTIREAFENQLTKLLDNDFLD